MTLPALLRDDVWIAEPTRIVWVFHSLFRVDTAACHNSIPVVLKILSPLFYFVAMV
jgi:hypothetical protein